MHLCEVNSKSLEKDFLLMAKEIYKNDKNWVRPLDNDINTIFDRKKNKLFKDGDAIRWVLKNTDGKIIGRIAAFFNRKTARSQGMMIGGCGFFECIDNQDAANLLFETAKNWLAKNGMEGMDGPINFGDRNQWWGCLFEGFYPPTYQMNYNPPYYNALFENYGFKVYFNQLVFTYPVSRPIAQKYYDKAERVHKDPLYRFENIKKNELPKFAEHLTLIYNEAWAKMGHFKPVNARQTLQTLKKMKAIMEEDLIWFGYYGDKPVSFFVMLPQINQIVRHLDGNLNWWGKIKFAYYRWRGVCDQIFGVLFGVVPEHQGKGVEGAMIIAAAKVVQPRQHYKEMEMNWVGDFNPKMIHLVQDLGTQIHKQYHTFRYLFDRNKPFERAPITT